MFATSAPEVVRTTDTILFFYLMITIIFIAEDGNAVHLSFRRNEDLNTTHNYGTWNTKTNEIELNDKGWEVFQKHRNEIRKLKPLLEHLHKTG